MRALVIGGSGQIGGWLLRVLAERGRDAIGTYASVPYPGLVHLDAADLDGAADLVRSSKPDVVFYPAGFTWVDGCEKDPDRADGANVRQPLHVARAAADQGARFVYFSTDYVFDGHDGPYAEDAPTHPLSEYGRAKERAERVLAEALGDRLLTIRTAWVFGPERQGKNFAYQLVKTLAAGKPFGCPSDQHSNPSYGPDVALASVLLAEQERAGIMHVAGPEVIGRVAFARSIATAFDLDPDPIFAKTSAELGQTALRPNHGGLLTPNLPHALRDLPASLADFRERLADNEGWANPFPA
jgi:dTDP-4-dehydrorhamnose reductase